MAEQGKKAEDNQTLPRVLDHYPMDSPIGRYGMVSIKMPDLGISTVRLHLEGTPEKDFKVLKPFFKA